MQKNYRQTRRESRKTLHSESEDVRCNNAEERDVEVKQSLKLTLTVRRRVPKNSRSVEYNCRPSEDEDENENDPTSGYQFVTERPGKDGRLCEFWIVAEF